MKIIMIPLLVSISIFVQTIKSQNCCQEKTVNKIKPKPCLNCFSLSIFQIIASCELFSFNVYVSSSSLVTFAVIWRRTIRNLSICQNDVIRKLPGWVSGWLQLHQGRRLLRHLLLLRLRLLQLHLQHGLTHHGQQRSVRFSIAWLSLHVWV